MRGERVDLWHAGVKIAEGVRIEIAEEVTGASKDEVGWATEQIGWCDSHTGLIAVPTGGPEPQPYDPDRHGVPHARS
jgi:hypothetical protein